MDYASLLGHLEEIVLSTNEQEFDARMVSLWLMSKLLTRTDHYRDLQIARSVHVKRISNDLNRLNRMQLLKKKRVDRSCRVKRSDEERKCNRGFMYQYSFTKQGQKYTAYLRRTQGRDFMQRFARQHQDLTKDYEFGMQEAIWQKKLPSALASIAWQYLLFMRYLDQDSKGLKGRYRRFPPRIDVFVLFLIARIAKFSHEKDASMMDLIDELGTTLHEVNESLAQERAGNIKKVNELLKRLTKL